MAQITHILDRHRQEERVLCAAARSSRRRRVVVAATLVVYTVLLGWSLRIPAGDPVFYPATVSLAVVLLIGVLLSGPPLRPLRSEERGSWALRLGTGMAAGAALLVVFLLGATVVAPVPLLRGPVDDLLAHATADSLAVLLLITAANGVVEELFYRGTFYDAVLGTRPVLVTTAVYTVVGGLSGVPLLALAGLVVGGACALLRRRSRGTIASIACHLTWSLGMLLLLPRVLDLLDRWTDIP